MTAVSTGNIQRPGGTVPVRVGVQVVTRREIGRLGASIENFDPVLLDGPGGLDNQYQGSRYRSFSHHSVPEIEFNKASTCG